MIGQTQNAGFQIGVRRTFNVPANIAWDFLTSVEGVKLWLGDTDIQWETGSTYTTSSQAHGTVRVFNPRVNIRLTWQPKGWSKPSLTQVRVINEGEKTIVSFHQEQLAGPKEREEMRQRWQGVLAELGKHL